MDNFTTFDLTISCEEYYYDEAELLFCETAEDEDLRQLEDEAQPVYAGLSHSSWMGCALNQEVAMEMHPNEDECGCNGLGVLVSSHDTEHVCRYHGANAASYYGYSY
jgi:hypothetical protein